MSLIVVVEGDTDLPVARKLAADAKLAVHLELDRAGKGNLDKRLEGDAAAAQGSPYLVLRDLDHDASCAPDLLRTLAVREAPWMCLRIVVRAIESWILADRESVASYLKVPLNLVPDDPDGIEDPKRALVSIARKSTSRQIQRALVPKPDASATVGPLYEAGIIELGTRYWRLDVASERSDSLRRARKAVRLLGRNWRSHNRGR